VQPAIRVVIRYRGEERIYREGEKEINRKILTGRMGEAGSARGRSSALKRGRI
jgi:hypothetical protein